MKLDEIKNLTEPQAVKHYIEIGKEYRSIEEKIVTSFMLAFGSLFLSIIVIGAICALRIEKGLIFTPLQKTLFLGLSLPCILAWIVHTTRIYLLIWQQAKKQSLGLMIEEQSVEIEEQKDKFGTEIFWNSVPSHLSRGYIFSLTVLAFPFLFVVEYLLDFYQTSSLTMWLSVIYILIFLFGSNYLFFRMTAKKFLSF